MKKLGRWKYSIVFIALIWGIMVEAQNDRRLAPFFQQTSVGSFVNNPSILMNTSWGATSISPLTSFNVEMQLPYSLHTLFSQNTTTNSYLIDFGKIAEKTARNNSLFLNAAINWVSVSGGQDNTRWNFSIQDRLMAGFGFQDRFVNLINLGNQPFLGEIIEMKFPVNELHFRSYQFSWAESINDQLDVGITSKLYFGKSWIDVKSIFSLYTHEPGDQIDLTVNGKGRASLPVTLESVLNRVSTQSASSNYLFGMNNPGFGIDIGMTYRLNKQVQISACATDIGFIVWNANTTTFKANGIYNWNGIDLSGKFDFNQLCGLKEHPTMVSFRDSFLNQLIKPKEQNFITTAPMALNAGVTYFYKQNIELEAVTRVLFYGHFIRGYLSLNGAVSFNRDWKLYSGLSFSNRSYFNLPAGVGYQGRRLMMTFMVNNLFGVVIPNWSKTFGGSLNLTYRVVKNDNRKALRHYPFFQKNANKAVKILLFQNSE